MFFVTWWNGLAATVKVGVLAGLAGVIVGGGGLWLASATKPTPERLPLRAFLPTKCPLSSLAGQESLTLGAVLFDAAAAALPKVTSAASEQLKAAAAEYKTAASARTSSFLYRRDKTSALVVGPGCVVVVLGSTRDAPKEGSSWDLTEAQQSALKDAGIELTSDPDIYLELGVRLDASSNPSHFRLEPQLVYRSAGDSRRSFSALVTLETLKADGTAQAILAADFVLAAIRPGETVSGSALPSLSSKWFPLPKPRFDSVTTQTLEKAQDGKETLTDKTAYIENLRPLDVSIVLTETYDGNPYLLMVADILQGISPTLTGAVEDAGK